MQDNASPAHKFIETFKGEFLVEPKPVTKRAAGFQVVSHIRTYCKFIFSFIAPLFIL